MDLHSHSGCRQKFRPVVRRARNHQGGIAKGRRRTGNWPRVDSDDPLLEVRVALENEAEHRREDEQQREDREEAVVGDRGGRGAARVVGVLLKHRERKRPSDAAAGTDRRRWTRVSKPPTRPALEGWAWNERQRNQGSVSPRGGLPSGLPGNVSPGWVDRSLPLPSSSAFSDSRLARQKANLSSLRGIATSRSLVSLRPSCMSWPFGVRQCFRIETRVEAPILPFASSVCFVPAAGMPPPSPYVAYADNNPR